MKLTRTLKVGMGKYTTEIIIRSTGYTERNFEDLVDDVYGVLAKNHHVSEIRIVDASHK